MKRYTTSQAAAVIGISNGLVRRYCRQGRLGELIGRNYSITEKQLRRFLDVPRTVGPPVKNA